MKVKSLVPVFTLTLFWLVCAWQTAFTREILFCGEQIPMNNNIVADKLMNVIRRQIPNVNLPHLRKRVKANFPIVEYYLRETGLPEDFKYLAIVESGFQNLTSIAGARGFWQLMPETAREWGLVVSNEIDERDDIYKSTYAACKVLASYYLQIRKKYGISSWVLTAAAYNFGIGNINNAINRQGKDYFSMHLNAETAVYVYKIIAVKELFESPEVYMDDLGYNVFAVNKKPTQKLGASPADTAGFSSMVVKVAVNDGMHPADVRIREPVAPINKDLEAAGKSELEKTKFHYLSASIKGRYKNFEDGELIAIELLENFQLKNNFTRKGSQMKGKGWIIDDRVFVDLGYGSQEVSLLDITGKKGVSLADLKNNTRILLKVARS